MKGIAKQLPWFILSLGGVVTCIAAWNLAQQIESDARSAFHAHAVYFESAIASRLRTYEDVLFGLAARYHSDNHVTPEEFNAYVASLDLPNRAPAIDNINYAEYVRAADRERFAATFEQDIDRNSPNVRGLNMPPGKEEYMIVTRSTPPNVRSVGMDVWGNPRRYSSGDSMEPLTGLYHLNQLVSTGMPIRPPGKSFVGLALRLGVFDTFDMPSPQLKGTVGMGIKVEEFFEEAVPSDLATHISYRLENIGRLGKTTYTDPVPIFSSDLLRNTSAHADNGETYTTSFVLPFGGALLRFEVSEARSRFVSIRDSALPYAVLIAGFLLFAMAAALSRKTLLRNAELKRAVALRTADLTREVERGKQLEHELANAAEEERHRVGHELHDELGQRLTSISLSSKGLEEALRPVSPELSTMASALVRDTSQAIASVRGLAHGLMPVPVGGRGLRDALDQLAINTSASGQVKCIFDFEDPVDINDKEVATNLYRIAQEAVNNAIRHSGATVICIELDYENGKITMTVSDNGTGFDYRPDTGSQAVQSTGAGMRIMAYRASAIGYAFTVQLSTGHGTIIKVQET